MWPRVRCTGFRPCGASADLRRDASSPLFGRRLRCFSSQRCNVRHKIPLKSSAEAAFRLPASRRSYRPLPWCSWRTLWGRAWTPSRPPILPPVRLTVLSQTSPAPRDRPHALWSCASLNTIAHVYSIVAVSPQSCYCACCLCIHICTSLCLGARCVTLESVWRFDKPACFCPPSCLDCFGGLDSVSS